MHLVPVHVIDPDHPQGRDGHVRFAAQTAHIQVPGSPELVMRYDGAQAMLGGTKDATIVVTLMGDGHRYIRLYIQSDQLADHLDPQMPPTFRNQLLSLSRKKQWSPMKPFIIAGSLAALAGAIWFGTLLAFDLAVNAVPPKWEIEFGKLVGQSMAAEEVTDKSVTGPVQELAKRITAVLPKDQPYPFHFHVIDERVPNAFALPGGMVMITTGLLQEASSADEVAGIVGHEVQHVLGRHTFRRMAKELGMGLLIAVFVGDQATWIVESGRSLIGLQFDRTQELESDRIGLKLAHDAGFKATALGDFFKRQQEKAKGLDDKTEKVLSYLSTHPAHSDRLEQIAQLAKQLPPQGQKAAPIPGWAAMKAKLKQGR